MSRVDRDSQNIYWFFTDIVPYGLTNVVKIVGIAVIMLTISPLLSLGIILTISVIEIVQHQFTKASASFTANMTLQCVLQTRCCLTL